MCYRSTTLFRLDNIEALNERRKRDVHLIKSANISSSWGFCMSVVGFPQSQDSPKIICAIDKWYNPRNRMFITISLEFRRANDKATIYKHFCDATARYCLYRSPCCYSHGEVRARRYVVALSPASWQVIFFHWFFLHIIVFLQYVILCLINIHVGQCGVSAMSLLATDVVSLRRVTYEFNRAVFAQRFSSHSFVHSFCVLLSQYNKDRVRSMSRVPWKYRVVVFCRLVRTRL